MIAGADLLAEDWGVQADLWSCPSFNELHRDIVEVERWNRLHPEKTPRLSHVEQCLAETTGPVIAATDYVKRFADQIRATISRRYTAFGTDGYGRSDFRKALRSHFEVDRYHVAVTASKSLVDEEKFPPSRLLRLFASTVLIRKKPTHFMLERVNTCLRSRKSRSQISVTSDDVEIIEILVKPGDSLKAEDPVMTLESDKATMDVPCSEDGQVAELLVKVGDRVAEGTSILQLQTAGASEQASTEAVQTLTPSDTPSTDPALASGPVASASVDVIVPDIGDFEDVEIIEVFVKPGDAVQCRRSVDHLGE